MRGGPNWMRRWLALRLAGMWSQTSGRQGGLADVDSLGRARIQWLFRARDPYEEALRDSGSRLLDTKEEAEEGSGAILTLWTEPPALLVPALSNLSFGDVIEGLTQTCARELSDF